MSNARVRSDALVFFGASGDLAFKKIFPAFQALARRGKLDFPVIGFGRSGWKREQLIERARASVTENGGYDERAFAILAERLEYVDGDYNDPAAFERIHKVLSARDAHRRVRARLSRLNGYLQEVLQGMRVVQVFRRERAVSV